MPVEHIASADLGSNSFHIVIAEVKENRTFRIIDRRREVIRIGLTKNITHDETVSSIQILKVFKQLSDKYKARIIAAATSAVRESSNAYEFLGKIFKETSVKVEIISGRREAELIYSGAAAAISLKKKNGLVIDIGGGSTEIIFGVKGKIVFAESLKLGSVRLMEKFFPGYFLSPEKIDLCKKFVKEKLIEKFARHPVLNFDIAAGSSGTIMSAASTIYFNKTGRIPEKINGLPLAYGDLVEFSRIVLSKSSKEERLSIQGIEKNRADILPAGLLILIEVFDFFNINSITLSEYGLREGLIISYLNSQATT